MKPTLVLAEWHRAQESMRAAEVLTKGGCSADAISRTYYAVLHAAKAALYVRGVAADTHRAIRQMFGLHLISAGEIEKSWSAHLGKGFDQRLAADYDAEISFSEAEAIEACRLTRRFLRRIRQYLLSKGFTPSQLRRKRRA
jgi:uncharacterized protein (UPF0332 family)